MHGAALLAGQQGLHHHVVRVVIVESPEKLEAVSEGDLVLSSSAALAAFGDVTAELVGELALRKAAGLVLRRDADTDDLWLQLLQQAEAADFPFIQLPEDVSYPALLHEIVPRTHGARVRMLEEAEKVRDTFAQLGLRGATIRELADELNTFTGAEVYVTNDLYGTIVYAGHFDEATGQARFRSLANRLATGDMRVGPTAVRAGTRLLRGGPPFLLLAPVTLQDRMVGKIILVREANPFGEPESVAAKEVATLVTHEFLRQEAVSEELVRLRGDLLDDILDGKTPDPIALQRAERLGFDLERPFGLLAIAVEGTDDATHLDLGGPLQARGIPYLLTHRPDFAALLVQLPDSTAPEQLHAIAHDLSREAGWMRETAKFGIGVSRPHRHLSMAPQALREAWLALFSGLRLARSRFVNFFDQLGIERLLCHPDGLSSAKEFVRDVLGPLLDGSQRSRELLETAEVFLETAHRPSETARRLHVHRSTILYRLERLEQMLGIDFNNPLHRLNMAAAIRFARLLSVDL